MSHKKSVPNIKIQLKRSQKFIKAGQMIFLTCTNFQSNSLWESASACSFGFIFSFVPLALIILTMLVGIIRVSPGILNYITAFGNEIDHIVDITPFLNNIMNKNNFHIVDIFLGFWMVWMARKLSLSVIQAMNKIFNSVTKRKGIFTQALTFLSEFIIILLIAAIIIFAFIFNQIISSDLFEPLRKIFPSYLNQNSHTIITFIMYFAVFVLTLLIYRYISGTKPPFKLCFFYALLCSVCFYFISIWVSKFMNLTNYNIVYGTISTIIVLMMKVYFFFVSFLFFAQMIYISQYFESILQSEVYLLPDEEQTGFAASFRRMMFVNAAALKTQTNARYYKAGDVIFSNGEKADFVYYIRTGSISVDTNGISEIYEKGSFIADTNCLLNQPYSGTATAREKCKLIVFTDKEFKELLQKSPKAAAKAISKLTDETLLKNSTTE